MRTPLTVLLLLLACSQQLFAQAYLQPKIPANAPTTTQVRAPNGVAAYTTLRAYALYPANEFTEFTAGTVINQFGFVVTNGVNTPAGGQIKVYMQNTSDATFQKSNDWVTGVTPMTEVYNGTIALPVTNGKAEIIVTLDAPFTYTGGGLYVGWDYLGTTFATTPVTYAAEGSILIPGCMSNNSASTTPPTTLGSTAFRPQLILGFNNPFQHDIAVTQLKATRLFSYGLGGANKATAVIVNKGGQNQTNITVSWTAAGLTYTSVIPSLNAGDSTTTDITLSPPAAGGTIQIEAAVGADDRNINNSMQILQTLVCEELRYADVVTPDESVGFNTGAGIIAAKYTSPVTAMEISAIRTRLSTRAGNIGNILKGVVLDENGVILATSADFEVTSSNNNTEVTIPLTTPVVIPANTSFFAGMIQTANSAGYYPFGSAYKGTSEPNRYFTFSVSGGTPAQVLDLGEIMIGFAGLPVAELTSSVTGVLKQGQQASITATTGFRKYDFFVNNILRQSSSSNVFTYTPQNNDLVSVSIYQGPCAYTTNNTIPVQVTELAPTAGILYVKKGGTGNGSSWANAAGELADALLAARSNAAITEIWVAGGVYYPAYSAEDTDNGQSAGRKNSFVLPGNIKVYGGFAGTETTLGERKLSLIANKTILSGDIDNNDDANGAIAGNNALHVVVGAGTGTPLLDGLTIAGGNANMPGAMIVNGQGISSNYGGGIHAYNTSLQLNSVTLKGNIAENGGGLFNGLVNMVVSNSLFTGNKATIGAGISNAKAVLTLVNATLSGNNGAAIYNILSSPVIANSIIYGNSTGIEGDNAAVTYSIVQSGYTGTGNTSQDPLFITMPAPATAPFVGGDYALQTNSPAVNTGNNATVLTLPAAFQSADIMGNTRIVNQAGGGIVDRGAYELQRQSQLITAADINKVYGDADFEPGATTTSGLTISYASSDNNIAEAYQDATDSNKWKIKVKRAGAVTITASQAGTPDYFPAVDEEFDLSIATKPVTVEFTSQALSKPYDGTANGTLTLANLVITTGNVINGDNVQLTISATSFIYDNKNAGNNKLITFPLSAISLSGAGAGNYNIANTTNLTATIGTITPATVTVTANAQTKVYGKPDPAFTYSYSGFVTGDAAAFTGALSRNMGENAGNYLILLNTLSAGSNYTIQYSGANLTISKATQTITWVQDLITGCNGVAPIILTATSSSGLPVTYQVASPSIATVTGQTLTPVSEGATTITAIQAGDANHEAAIGVPKTFGYQLSNAIRQHFADALFFDNSSGKYIQWQWYKNGNLVPGFNTPYYNEAAALNGTYYALVTDKNGNILQTCPVTLTGSGTAASSLKVAPNPAKAGATVNVTCGYSETALQGAVLQLSNISGTVMQRITTVRPANSVVMPAAGGLYVITLTLANGQKATVNVLVN